MTMTNAERCKRYYESHREERKEQWRKYRQNNLDRYREYYRQRHQGYKVQVFARYGSECRCCGETTQEFLTIDHINNDGNEHRKKGVTQIYRWLVLNGFPEGFQVLCWNCNAAKQFSGGCPHQYQLTVVSGG